MAVQTVQDQIDRINELAERNDLFWVAAAAQSLYPILIGHLDELADEARWAVEHYTAHLPACDPHAACNGCRSSKRRAS